MASFLFIGLYFEVFMLLTLFERKDAFKESPKADISDPEKLPSVTVIVPCYNEQETVVRTVESLLDLDYPKKKLRISIVDDGSTDNTWEYISMYSKHPQIDTYKKKNGGKYTAMNYAIKRAKTDLVGCLDADSFVDKDALLKMVRKFQDDPETMAVAPAVKIYKPDSFFRALQYIEYIYGIFMKKLYSFLGAIHVTPGPFSIFRRGLFEEIGYFRHAHSTEDMEIAMRMHKNHKKIDNCHDAYVYTVGPRGFKGLYKQRVRWTYGFIKNCFDYRSLFFNRKHGNVGFLTLPLGLIGIVGAIVAISFVVINFVNSMIVRVQRIRTVGFQLRPPHFTFDAFFLSTHVASLLILCTLVMSVTILIMSQKMTGHSIRKRHFILYLAIYPFVAMTWICKSAYNAALSRGVRWR